MNTLLVLNTLKDIPKSTVNQLSKAINISETAVKGILDTSIEAGIIEGSVNLEKVSPDGLSEIASMCAWTLAHAHAKTGDRHGIAGYLGKSKAFEEAMLRFAQSYADQNERDFEVFCSHCIT